MTPIPFSLLQQGFYINLNWLGQLVKIIIGSVGSVGVGVIVFALILKAITTPFDIYQRVMMRKQNLIMKKMQPDLEKLQKQYANDKQTYSMKMLELQKKNGYSMFGACLPTIISFVILILAITAFQSYAQYANLAMYENMAQSYNAAILEYAPDGKYYHYAAEGEESNELVITAEKFAADEQGKRSFTEGELVYTLIEEGEIERMQVESTSGKIYFFYQYNLKPAGTTRSYFIDAEKLQRDTEIWTQVQSLTTKEVETEEGTTTETIPVETACLEYFQAIGSKASAQSFRTENNPGFLWVKNVWYPDVAYNHPIQNYTAFSQSFGNIHSDTWEGSKNISGVISESDYNILTAELSAEKTQANGYFVMILLSIGLMLLSQFIMMRSSKTANQYQTVDGQGATSQKVMMVVMPLMFAIFGFMWSAAFTIYNVISSAISIVVTLITNVIIDRIFKKRDEEELKERYTRTAPWKDREKKDTKSSKKRK